MKSRFHFLLVFFLVVGISSTKVFAGDYKIFKTKYTTIYYNQDQDLSSFLWRIGGIKEVDIHTDFTLAKNRIDRIVSQVEAILDMYPERFHIDIYISAEYKEGSIAFYSHKTKSITVFVDRITDGVLAHEIAHAVINSYFSIPPPKRIQEILTQYVDRHLWEEYR